MFFTFKAIRFSSILSHIQDEPVLGMRSVYQARQWNICWLSNKCDLESRFWATLADDGDVTDAIHGKMNLLLQPESSARCDPQEKDQIPFTSALDSLLLVLTTEQCTIAWQIIDTVIHRPTQLMFLQGSAATEQTFTVKTLITTLESIGKKYSISSNAGIVAVQYPGGTTIHSLFRLGIDDEFTSSFRSNIGHGSLQAQHLLAAELTIINTVSILTPWVANRIFMTLQPISVHDRIEFGGKMMPSSLTKSRRCPARQKRNRTAVLQFGDDETRALTRIPMEKPLNDMKFMRRHLLLRLIFTGTVH
jgi:hypothetical protein